MQVKVVPAPGPSAPAPVPAAPMPAAPVLAALVPALVMLGLGLWGLERGTLWRDEGDTAQVVRRSLPEIWHLLHHVDAVHGLYYLVLHVLLPGGPAGPGEFALRLPSVLAASCAAALVAALGTRLARPRVGLWAGLLYAVTPFAGHYAQEGRSYALVAAGAALATLLLVRAVERTAAPPARRAWCAYAAAAAGTALLHELAALLLLAHAATLLLARAPRRVWRGWAAAAGAVALALLPLLLVSGAQSAQVAWLVAPDGAAAEGLLRSFAGPAPLVLAGQLLLAALAAAPPWRRAGRLSVRAVALPLLVLPPLALLTVSQRWPLYHDRYVLFALAGLPLLVAAGSDRAVRAVRAVRAAGSARARGTAADGPARSPVPWPRAWPRAAVAVVGVAAVGAVLWSQLPAHRLDRTAGRGPDDPAAVAAFAARTLRPGEPVLYLPSRARRVTLAHPDAFRGARDIGLAASPAASGTLYGVETGPAELRRRLVSVDRLWVLTEPRALSGDLRRPVRPGVTPENVKIDLLEREFAPRARHVLPGATLRLYVRRCAAPDTRARTSPVCRLQSTTTASGGTRWSGASSSHRTS